jgi:hypothetical protein
VVTIPLQQPDYLLWRKIWLSNCSYPASYINVRPKTSCFDLRFGALLLRLLSIYQDQRLDKQQIPPFKFMDEYKDRIATKFLAVMFYWLITNNRQACLQESSPLFLCDRTWS